jgi:hypothetical protein
MPTVPRCPAVQRERDRLKLRRLRAATPRARPTALAPDVRDRGADPPVSELPRQRRERARLAVSPLAVGPPRPGPLAFVCQWPGGQLPTSGVEIDASLVLEAADRVIDSHWPAAPAQSVDPRATSRRSPRSRPTRSAPPLSGPPPRSNALANAATATAARVASGRPSAPATSTNPTVLSHRSTPPGSRRRRRAFPRGQSLPGQATAAQYRCPRRDVCTADRAGWRLSAGSCPPRRRTLLGARHS